MMLVRGALKHLNFWLALKRHGYLTLRVDLCGFVWFLRVAKITGFVGTAWWGSSETPRSSLTRLRPGRIVISWKDTELLLKQALRSNVSLTSQVSWMRNHRLVSTPFRTFISKYTIG